jgi:hypothetical protein
LMAMSWLSFICDRTCLLSESVSNGLMHMDFQTDNMVIFPMANYIPLIFKVWCRNPYIVLTERSKCDV